MTASTIRWTLTDAWTLTLRGLQYWRREPIQIIAGLGFMIMSCAVRVPVAAR